MGVCSQVRGSQRSRGLGCSQLPPPARPRPCLTPNLEAERAEPTGTTPGLGILGATQATGRSWQSCAHLRTVFTNIHGQKALRVMCKGAAATASSSTLPAREAGRAPGFLKLRPVKAVREVVMGRTRSTRSRPLSLPHLLCTQAHSLPTTSGKPRLSSDAKIILMSAGACK